LGDERAAQVRWIVDDVTRPTQLHRLQDIALWHDRALLHFLIEAEDREAYRSTMLQVLRPGGYVILAAFALEGARRCSGLPVRNYSLEMLDGWLGETFEPVDGFDHEYHMPSGDLRQYVYGCFRRVRTF
jgi:hypothetical protein